MKDQLLVMLFTLLASGCFAQEGVAGKWKTLDDNTGKARSVVEIFERNDKIYGKIIKLYLAPSEDADPVCDECDEQDSRYGKKIIGMEILKDMKKNGTEYADGNILDPETGKVYRCRLWLEKGDLMIRGYWGPFYRTQVWKRFP